MSSGMDEQFQRAIRAAQDAQEQSRDANAGLREDLVETSVQFWTDPRMSDKTAQSKEQFLEQKGLTRREIAEVRKRARLANPPHMPPNTAFSGDAANGAGRTNIGGANIQYIPIPIPTAPGQSMTAPTFMQRVGGWLQVIGTGMAAVAGASYVYHQYQNNQFYNHQGWGQFARQQNQNQQNQQNQNQLMEAQGQGQGPGGEISNALVPVRSGSDSGDNATMTDPNIRRAGDDAYRREADDMKRSLRNMQERIEAQSAQLRDAVKSLNDIVSTQNTQAANHTSMGLLLANTAASQTAQERSIRDELNEIKEMIRARLKEEGKGLRTDQETGSSSSSGGSLSRKLTSASASGSPSSSSSNDGKNSGDGSGAAAPTEEPTQEEMDAARQRKLDADLDEKRKDISEAVAHVIKNNSNAAARKTGYGMMEMLLKNLAENPMQPRYRKIAIGNKNFERCLKKLDGHDQLLTACGFTKNAKNFEWSLLPKSHEVNEEEMDWAKKLNDAVLKFARDAIKDLTAEAGTTPAAVAAANPRAETTVDSSLAIPAPASSSSPAVTTTPLTPVPTGAGGRILTTPEVVSQNDEVTSTTTVTAKVKPTAKAIPISSSTLSTTAAVEVSAAASDTKTAETKVPQYPLAFKEVLKLVEEGKDPPGIRKIPEQLSSDAQKFLGSTNMQPSGAATKPWEVQTGPEVEVLDGPEPGNK